MLQSAPLLPSVVMSYGSHPLLVPAADSGIPCLQNNESLQRQLQETQQDKASLSSQVVAKQAQLDAAKADAAILHMQSQRSDYPLRRQALEIASMVSITNGMMTDCDKAAQVRTHSTVSLFPSCPFITTLSLPLLPILPLPLCTTLAPALLLPSLLKFLLPLYLSKPPILWFVLFLGSCRHMAVCPT